MLENNNVVMTISFAAVCYCVAMCIGLSMQIRCPIGIKRFAAESPTSYYLCEKPGTEASLYDCSGGGLYNSATQRCEGGKEQNKEPKKPSKARKAKSRIINDDSKRVERRSTTNVEGATETPKEHNNQPTLGYPVTLGALYYERSNRIANDENLWRVKTLENNKIIENIESSTSNTKITQSTIDRMDAFKLSASVGMTIMVKIDLEGAASFLTARRTKEKSVSVSFLYESVVRTEYLSQDMRNSLDFPEVCKYLRSPNPPTHIVSSLTYGFRGILDFQREVEESSTNNEIALELRVALDLFVLSAEGEASLDLGQNNTAILEKVTCKYYGDAILNSAPMKYKEALETYKKFPELAKKSRTVIFYSLSPIDKYCGDEDIIPLNVMSPTLIVQIRESLAEMEETELRAQSLYNLDTARKESTTIGRIIYDFIRDLKQFSGKWRTRLRNIYRTPEGKDHPDNTLAELVEDYNTSPWEIKNASCYLDERKRELETIRSIIPQLKGITREERGSGDGNKCRFENPWVVNYELRILPNPKAIVTYNCSNDRGWNDTEIMKAGALYKRFIGFHKANKEKKTYCFLVSMKEINKNESTPASILLSHEGDIKEKAFLPPAKVGKPRNIAVFQDKLKFSIRYNRENMTLTNQIKVQHATTDNPKAITTNIFPISANGNNTLEITIRDLKPKLCYEISIFGGSNEYDGVATDFRVFTNPFTQPMNFKKVAEEDTSLKLRWLKPEHKITDNDTFFGYNITLEKVGGAKNGTVEKLPSLALKGSFTEKTITGLEPSQKYRISIETVSYFKNDYCHSDYIDLKYHAMRPTIIATTLPATLSSPTVTNITETTVRVCWSDLVNTQETRMYTLEYRRINQNTTKDFIEGVKETRQTIKTVKVLRSLAAGAAYEIKVRVETSVGKSKFSPGVIFNTVALANKTRPNLREKLLVVKSENQTRGISYSLSIAISNITYQML